MKEEQTHPSAHSDPKAKAAARKEDRPNKEKPSSVVSRWRNAILGTLLVLAGLATALFTILARRIGDPGLAGTGAIASLIFALQIGRASCRERGELAEV